MSNKIDKKLNINTNSNNIESTELDRRGTNNKWTQQAEKVVGQGTFGIVFKANVEETGEVVAIKKVQQDKRYKNRELQILRELDHPNIIQLKHAFQTKGEKQDELYLNAVTEFIPDTISRVTRYYSKNKQHLPILLVKIYSWQMMRALAYIHSKNICHRDIKPQNLLIDPQTHVLKVCDFGSAKRLISGEPNVSYICSRYYRAPELIFGATHQTCTIDVWSVGTVIGEMLLGHPLQPGESAVDQLVEIIKVLGTPTKEQICIMNENQNEYKFPQIKPATWQQVFKRDLGQEVYDFISKLLIQEPHLRLTPTQALLHPFFDELQQPQTRTPENKGLPELFNFTKEEYDQDKESISKILEKKKQQHGV